MSDQSNKMASGGPLPARGNRPTDLNDRLRLVILLDACEAANIAPVPIMRLHALIFLANVLGPVWSLESYDGKILKRKGGPFYPELQRELDRLVGIGLVSVHEVDHSKGSDGRWRLEGSFALNTAFTQRIMDTANLFAAERAVGVFVRRLVFAAGRLTAPIEELVAVDATWADTRTGMGDVIDFSEWKRANYSAFAASFFQKAIPSGAAATRGDKLQLYMRLLERRANAAS